MSVKCSPKEVRKERAHELNAPCDSIVTGWILGGCVGEGTQDSDHIGALLLLLSLPTDLELSRCWSCFLSSSFSCINASFPSLQNTQLLHTSSPQQVAMAIYSNNAFSRPNSKTLLAGNCEHIRSYYAALLWHYHWTVLKFQIHGQLKNGR